MLIITQYICDYYRQIIGNGTYKTRLISFRPPTANDNSSAQRVKTDTWHLTSKNNMHYMQLAIDLSIFLL